MPGCVNGACRKEIINDKEEEIAQTCECERFSPEHVLTNETYKFTGRFCDQRKCKRYFLSLIVRSIKYIL